MSGAGFIRSSMCVVIAAALAVGCNRDDQKQQSNQQQQQGGQGQAPAEPAFAGKPTDDWLAAVRDTNPETRLEAAHALRTIGAGDKAKTLPALRAMVKDSCYPVRAEAIDAVLAMDPSADKAELASASAELLDGTRADRVWAVATLKALGPAAKLALPKLKETLESGTLDGFDKEAVRKAIDTIEGN